MINQAVVIGRSHRIMQQNCQDFSITRELQPGLAFGVVLDGCGSKYRGRERSIPSNNEVGSKLLGQFADAYLSQSLSNLIVNSRFGRPALLELINGLYSGTLDLLAEVVKSIPFADEAARVEFVATHLLSTVLGFVITPDAGAFFGLGDGFLCQNSQITRLESQNQPDYLAYRLVDGDLSMGSTSGFQIEIIENSSECNWLAVATDGWNESLVGMLETPRQKFSLQRWVNCQARQRGQFEDDGAAAVWWRS